MSYNSVILADSPAALWRHGESAGTTLVDDISARDLTTVNSPTLSLAGALLGDANTAIGYGRTTAPYAKRDSSVIATGDVWSIEFWVKRKSTFTGSQYGIICDIGCNHNGTQGVPVVSWGDGTSGQSNRLFIFSYGFGYWAQSTTTITDTTAWHHIVITKNGGTSKIWIDTVDVTNVTSAKTFATPPSGGIIWGCDAAATAGILGGFDTANGCDSIIDEAAVYTSALSSGQVAAHWAAARGLAFGEATETDTAQPMTRAKSRALGLTTETDTAQPMTRAKSRALGLTTETDTAQPFSKTKFKVIGQPSETDTAQPITRVKSRALGLVTETDTALALAGKQKSKAIGQPIETDIALPIVPSLASGGGSRPPERTRQHVGT